MLIQKKENFKAKLDIYDKEMKFSSQKIDNLD